MDKEFNLDEELKNDPVKQVVVDPDRLNYDEFLNMVKLYCLNRRVHIPNNEQCMGCEILHFCEAPPAEYHADLIFQTLKIVFPQEMHHTGISDHS